MAIVTVCPTLTVPRLQVTSAVVTTHVPWDGAAVWYEMPAGAGSATWTFVAVFGPLLDTLSE